MNRKRTSVAQASKRAPADGRATEITAAMDALVHGYRTESELYTRVRKLTWSQRYTLREGWNLDRFRDLLDEKEDLLRMIGQIESELKGAKSLVLSRTPSQCPDRWKLETLLDRLTATIEEIRVVESANASLLEGALAAG
jgi:hypothetical protein